MSWGIALWILVGYGLTAFVLWSLFGSYVLALWFVGALAYPIVYMARRWKRAERAI